MPGCHLVSDRSQMDKNCDVARRSGRPGSIVPPGDQRLFAVGPNIIEFRVDLQEWAIGQHVEARDRCAQDVHGPICGFGLKRHDLPGQAFRHAGHIVIDGRLERVIGLERPIGHIGVRVRPRRGLDRQLASRPQMEDPGLDVTWRQRIEIPVLPPGPYSVLNRWLIKDPVRLPLQPVGQPPVNQRLPKLRGLRRILPVVATAAYVELLGHAQSIIHLQDFAWRHAHIVPSVNDENRTLDPVHKDDRGSDSRPLADQVPVA